MCMDSRLLQKHSLGLDQAAPLPSVWSTEIVIWRCEFIVVATERLLAILPQDDTRDSVKWGRDMGTRTISGMLSGWNLRRHVLEYEMHLPDDYYCTQYCSSRLSQYHSAFDRLGDVLPWTTFRDRQIQPALGDDASTFWLRSIEQAI